MNFDRVKKALTSHTHTRDKADKKTPYKCLECQKYYYDSRVGFANPLFLMLVGVVLGLSIGINEFSMVTQDNAVAIANILFPLISTTTIILGFDQASNVLNLKRTDKTRLVNKTIKVDYWIQLGLVITGALFMLAGFLLLFVVTELNRIGGMTL